MKIQISKFSSHQTAKVFAILMAVSSLLFMIPIVLMQLFISSPIDANENQAFGMMAIVFIMPIFQGIFGYLIVRFSLWVYNKLYKRIGGIEFEFEEIDL